MVRRLKDPPLSMRVLLTFARGDSAARATIVAEAAGSDSRQSQIAARYVATFLEDFPTPQSWLGLTSRHAEHHRSRECPASSCWLELARGGGLPPGRRLQRQS